MARARTAPWPSTARAMARARSLPNARAACGAGASLVVACLIALLAGAAGCAHDAPAAPATVEAALEEVREDIAKCSGWTRRRDPRAEGELLVRLEVGAEGRLTALDILGEVDGPDVSSRHLPRCIRARSAGWAFPRGGDGRFEVPVRIGTPALADAIYFPPDTRPGVDPPQRRTW